MNGRLYGIPRARDLVRNGLSWRQDWLDKLGLSEPKTLDDFYEMLYQFTYGDPDGNGLDDTYGMIVTEYAGPWDMMQIWFGAPNGWGIDENGDLIPVHMTKEYDTALDWFRRIYSEGLVNPDFNVLSSDEWNNKMYTGAGGCIVDTMARGRYMQNYFDQNDMQFEANMFYSVDMGYGYRCYPTDGYGGVLAISKSMVTTEEELRRVLQFLNDLNDAEMSDLIDYGFEGIHYFITEDGYYQYYTDEEKKALGVTTVNYRNGFNQVLAYFRTDEESAKRIQAVPETGMRALETKYMKEGEQYAVTNYALPYLKNIPTYSQNASALDEIIAQARVDYIMGVIDKTGLEECKNRWLSAGGQTIIDEVNALYHANN